MSTYLAIFASLTMLATTAFGNGWAAPTGVDKTAACVSPAENGIQATWPAQHPPYGTMLAVARGGGSAGGGAASAGGSAAGTASGVGATGRGNAGAGAQSPGVTGRAEGRFRSEARPFGGRELRERQRQQFRRTPEQQFRQQFPATPEQRFRQQFPDTPEQQFQQRFPETPEQQFQQPFGNRQFDQGSPQREVR
jgi:hypothetical protein